MNKRVKRLSRGFAMLIIFPILILLGVLVTMTNTLLQPAGSRLDAYITQSQAQALADSALQEALLRLDSGVVPNFLGERPVGQRPAGKVEVAGRPAGERMELSVVVQVPLERGPAKTVEVCLHAVASKTGRGNWQIKDYAINFKQGSL